MTTKKISQLTELTTPDNNDVLVINDVSALQTKKITFENLVGNTITSLSQSVTVSFAAESVARGTAINSAVSGLATTGSNIYFGNQVVTGSISATSGLTGSLKGNVDGNAATATTSSFSTNALTSSFSLNANTATSASYALTAGVAQTATTATSLAATTIFISLNGKADGVTTNIGSVYIPSTITIITNSLAYIGGSTASETAVLKLVPINSVTAAATWTRTNVLGSVALASSAVLAAGWYDVVLEAGSGAETSFARGLYITT